MPPERRALRVPKLENPERLDRYLASAWPDLSRSRIAALIETQAITVGGKPARAALKVSGGEDIAAAIPTPEALSLAPEEHALSILYQDKDVAVVDKPAGLTVHPSSSQKSGTLVNALLFALKDLSGIGGALRPGIVHRLDKNTSGVMIVAKNDRAHQLLSSAFAKREVDKHYIAFVCGTPPDNGEWSKPIGRHVVDRKRFAVDVPHAKTARTLFETVARYDNCAKLAVTLLTGRTHQIRVHAAAAGVPLIGDKIYARGTKKLPAVARDFPRQALHSSELTITLPNGKRKTFKAPLPEDLRALEAGLTR